MVRKRRRENCETVVDYIDSSGKETKKRYHNGKLVRPTKKGR